MGYQEIRYEERGDVALVTIDRPAARNALTLRTYAELTEAISSADVRCIVLTGEDPAFCAGDDVKQIMVQAGEKLSQSLDAEPRLTAVARALLETDVPVVAAVNGAAVGYGMELALMADIRVASDRARFGELFVARGLVCDVAGLSRLATLVGREAAAELLYTGRIVDADEARAMRLVSRVVPHDELLPAAFAVAERIAENPPLAVRRLKAGLRRALDPDWDDLGRWVSASLAELFRTEDHKEGVAAFLERRDPHFVGR